VRKKSQVKSVVCEFSYRISGEEDSGFDRVRESIGTINRNQQWFSIKRNMPQKKRLGNTLPSNWFTLGVKLLLLVVLVFLMVRSKDKTIKKHIKEFFISHVLHIEVDRTDIHLNDSFQYEDQKDLLSAFMRLGWVGF
jgi:hypothetical protein